MSNIPNRVIKESLRESKAVNSLTDFQFRLWLYLITYVDDYGRGKADPELLSSILFPRIKSITEKSVRDGLIVLEKKGLIICYQADDEPYFYFPNWAKHQRIQTKKSKFPAPPENLPSHGESPCNTGNNGESRSESNPIQSNTNQSKKESESESEYESNTNADAFEAFASGDDDLLHALKEFEKMRKKIKKPMTDNAKDLLVNKLQTFPREEWIAILNNSIMNSWQGIFPLEKQKEVCPF